MLAKFNLSSSRCGSDSAGLALGYNQTNAGGLIAKVQEGAQRYPAKLGAADKFGQRITIDMPITGPNGNTATVRTVRIYDIGSSTPRMTTLYVK